MESRSLWGRKVNKNLDLWYGKVVTGSFYVDKSDSVYVSRFELVCFCFSLRENLSGAKLEMPYAKTLELVDSFSPVQHSDSFKVFYQ